MSLELGRRLKIRSSIHVAAEPLPLFWPMRTFIHHNPLHGLEHLPFEEADSRRFWEAVRLRPGELSPEERAQLPSVRSEIRRNFPEAIRADEGADWSQWPGDVTLFLQ